MRYHLRIVTHCYALRLPFYAQALRYQIAGLFLHPPKCRVRLDVVFWDGDHAVGAVVDDAQQTYKRRASNVVVGAWVMPQGHLFRRAIARHKASQEVVADVLWYADCDYAFGEGALDAMAALGPKAGLCYPEFVLRSKSHEDGLTQVGESLGQMWPSPNMSLYKPHKEPMAIGGIQIIGAEAAKRVGYLGGTSWQEPVDPKLGFSNFRDDSRWRRSVGFGYGLPAPIPNVYRIRHAETGYNVSWEGPTDAKRVSDTRSGEGAAHE